MIKFKTYNDEQRMFFYSLNLKNAMAAPSTAVNNYHIYIEAAGQDFSHISHPHGLPDMSWLAPLVVRAFFLRTQMFGENGEPPQLDLWDVYNDIIEEIAQQLMPLPLKAMEIAKQVATDSIWMDIADAVAAHYKSE